MTINGVDNFKVKDIPIKDYMNIKNQCPSKCELRNIGCVEPYKGANMKMKSSAGVI